MIYLLLILILLLLPLAYRPRDTAGIKIKIKSRIKIKTYGVFTLIHFVKNGSDATTNVISDFNVSCLRRRMC